MVEQHNAVKEINNNITYYKLNESMRDAFCNDKWHYDKCEKYTTFVSQSNYPIKGFHLLLEVVSKIKKKYSYIKIYTTGNNIFNISFYRITTYQLYLKRLIVKYGLKDNILFIGYLD